MSKTKQPSSAPLLYGQHAVLAAIKAHKRKIYEVLTLDSLNTELHMLITTKKIKHKVVDKKWFNTQLPHTVHQGIAAHVSELPELMLSDVASFSRIALLDQVTDPHNVGAILRSAAAFGIEAVLVPERHSAKDSPIIAKTAVGALETVPLITVGNINQTLKILSEYGFWSIGLMGATETALNTIDKAGKLCIVLGSEGEGLRQLVAKNCDYLAKIPMTDRVESLNVSVAAGIAFYALKA